MEITGAWREMNMQFMRHLFEKNHILHKVQEVLVPPQQFERDQPDWAACFYIA